MSAPEPKQTGTSSAMRLAVAGAALLVVAGAAAFYFATQAAQGSRAPAAHRVAVTASACEPNELTVPAGERSFEIVNKSDRPVEWEILDGVMVVEERENIVPGFSQTLTARLQPGDYEITCGLLSNPRGTLHVMPSEEAAAATKNAPSLKAFIGPLSEYKVFLVLQGREMVAAAEELAKAIEAGDLEKARALYEPARLPYKRVEPVASRFADLQSAIAPLAAYLEKREQDPAFTGYHRIEYGLFAGNTTDGLAEPAQKLVADVTKLKDRLRGLKLTPSLLIDSAAHMAEQLSGQVATGDELYASTDLAGIAANLDGIDKIAGLIAPVLKGAAPEASADVLARLEALDGKLAALKTGETFPAYDTVDADARKALAADFRALADALEKLDPALATG